MCIIYTYIPCIYHYMIPLTLMFVSSLSQNGPLSGFLIAEGQNSSNAASDFCPCPNSSKNPFAISATFCQILERKEELAELESTDMGKPLDEALWDMVSDRGDSL